jgi:hypothetical protein
MEIAISLFIHFPWFDNESASRSRRWAKPGALYRVPGTLVCVCLRERSRARSATNDRTKILLRDLKSAAVRPGANPVDRAAG